MEVKIKSLPQKIHYTNTKEYRQVLRQIFDIPVSARTYYGDVDIGMYSDVDIEDEETKDELNYDDSLMEKGMEEWFLKTHHQTSFKELYLFAAGRMFSTDLRIGQAVICSYDTFSLYYTCIWWIYHNPTSDITHLEEYKSLKKWVL